VAFPPWPRALFQRAVADLPLRVELADRSGERVFGAGGPADPVMQGSVGIQAITMPHDRYLASRHTYIWIQKYVFPGGLIPSVAAMRLAIGDTSLRVINDLPFGPSYAETLRLWRNRFTAAEDQLDALGFDPLFRRMWTFYLAYSEAGFRARYLDVHQFVLRRPARFP
jgi:cyclopropane-fatty-acyl-phospholipid synthase